MSSNYVPPSEYGKVFERDTDHMRDLLDERGDWLELPEETPVRCSACRGTGLDRWEEDSCAACYGEGEVLGG